MLWLNWCTDTSDLRHFGRHWCRSVHWTFRYRRKNPRHEVSARHFGTSSEVSWTFRPHLYFVHGSVTLIYLFKKDYFIDDLWHIFRYFLYTTSLNFLYKKTSIQQTELAYSHCYVMVMQTEAVSSKQMVSFSILPNRPSLMRNSLFYTYLPNQYVVIADSVSSNRIVIYWQLTTALTSYMSSHLCSLQLHSSASWPIMFVADNAWLLTRDRL